MNVTRPDYRGMSVAKARNVEPRLTVLLYDRTIKTPRPPTSAELDLPICSNHPDYPPGNQVLAGSDAVVLLEGTVIINDYSPSPLYWTVQAAQEDAAPELTLLVHTSSGAGGHVPTATEMQLKIKDNHPNSPPGARRDVGGDVGVIILM